MNPKSTYKLGWTDIWDTLGIYYHLYFSDPLRELSLPCRLRIAKHVDLSSKPRILEMGPSCGVVTSASLCALGQDLTLFDKWGYWKQWFLLKKRNPKLKVVLGDGNWALPFQDASFDVCIFAGTLSYMTAPVETIREVGRILRPGGKIFISSTRRPENNILTDLGKLDKTMPTLWNHEELAAALQDTGFTLIDREEYGIYPRNHFALYRKYMKFKYFSGNIYERMMAENPDKMAFSGAVAVKN